jgi:hypothetical protein
VHSGFGIHRSRHVLPDERDDPPSRFACYGGTSLERLAQYTCLQRLWLLPRRRHCGQVIRNAFCMKKMQVNSLALSALLP